MYIQVRKAELKVQKQVVIFDNYKYHGIVHKRRGSQNWTLDIYDNFMFLSCESTKIKSRISTDVSIIMNRLKLG